MRGNRRYAQSFTVHSGSIPAYAGEPAATWIADACPEVYPRVCGGTGAVAAAGDVDDGLSPRMRGNHVRANQAGIIERSIPAYAGEPLPREPGWGRPKVYPRVCGGTASNLAAGTPYEGLSPRMRGNHQRARQSGGGIGSIPAYAGEPGHSTVRLCRYAVYPRVCGGTRF